jgi:amino acid transporter
MRRFTSRQLPVASLVAVVYFSVCGGTYGLESAVAEGGAWWAVALVVGLAFFWAVPIALVVGELSSTMPREGGAYSWARSELGEFWGCQTGWWQLCWAAVDMALYPVLFVHYLRYVVPELPLYSPLNEWLAAVALIALALVLNIAGVRAVGRSAVLMGCIVLAPLLVCSVLALWQEGAPAIAASPDSLGVGAMVGALSVVMWNYMGWENASTYAEEVENPQRSYPVALGAVVLLAVLTYLLPLLAGLSVFPSDSQWGDWTVWPKLGEQVGGRWLGVAVALAGVIAQWGLFNSSLLSSSRIPFAMARDGWLPKRLTRTGSQGAPTLALCVLAAVAAALAVWSFEKLIVIDVLLYSAVLAVEFCVFVKLRLRQPGRIRPFRVPGGWFGLVLVTLAPLACWIALILVSWDEVGSSATRQAQLAALALILALGLALYFARRRPVNLERRNP